MFQLYGLHKKVNLSLGLLIFLFGSKVLFGCINLYFHNAEYISNDAHYYYTGAMEMLHDFPNRPGYYIYDWFFNWGDIHNHLNFLNKENATYWSDIGRLLHTRFMIMSTALSFGNEYVNVLFYNTFFFVGLLALYKTFVYFKPNQKWIFLVIIFFIPSVAFWCSGIHKDGFILSLIGFVSWSVVRVYQSRNWKNILLLLCSLFFLLAFRYFYFIIFLPFFILALITRNKRRPVVYFLILSIMGVLAFFFLGELSSKFNLMSIVVNRQQEFVMSKGYSDMRTPVLESTPVSFVSNFPTALEHIFIRPLPKLGQKIKYDLAAFDGLIVLLLLLWAIIRVRRANFSNSYFMLLLFYSSFCLFFIGYTIPNLGALVRYESPFICILLLTLFALGDFNIKKLTVE